MANGTSASAPWRFRLGVVFFIAAFAIHLVTVVAIVAGASAATVGAIAAVNFALNKALLLAAAAIMGKPGFYRLKQLAFGKLSRYAPPHEVSPMRYRIGLILFVIPIFVGWATPYFPDIAPALGRHSVGTAILSDAIFIISLFVLGGGFWEKLRALFIRDAYAVTPD